MRTVAESVRLVYGCEGTLGLLPYPSTLTAHKYLHIINEHALGGVHACVLCCVDSVKVVYTIESVRDSNACYPHKGTVKETHMLSLLLAG